MSLHADYQKLEPGDEIRLFEIDGSAFNMVIRREINTQ